MPRFRRPRSPAAVARRVAAALLVAVALALALRPGPPAGAAAESLPVVVAARALDGGATLAHTDLRLARYPPGLAPDGAVAEPELLVGRVLAGGVGPGEPLTDVRLVGPGLTALLPEGQVAAPVRLTDLAVAGLVRTGDRVDVLATAPDAAEAELLAAGVRVLAAGGYEDEAAGLLLVAVDPTTAARLAAAATGATLTVSLPPP